jgi:hypothetical protein
MNEQSDSVGMIHVAGVLEFRDADGNVIGTATIETDIAEEHDGLDLS